MLTEQQKHKFEVTRQMAKEELEELDREISNELAKVKDKLLELQQAKSRQPDPRRRARRACRAHRTGKGQD